MLPSMLLLFTPKHRLHKDYGENRSPLLAGAALLRHFPFHYMRTL
jgi:hypothetical protein